MLKHLSPRVAHLLVLAAFVAILALLILPPLARANTWTSTHVTCSASGNERGSGQVDATGTFYIPCARSDAGNSPVIRIYAADGTLQRVVDVPGNLGVLDDVAPSPFGNYLYVEQRSTHTFRRLVRQDDGSYSYDASWSLARFAMGGSTWPAVGEFLATDNFGSIYVAMGTWANAAPYTVVKYDAQGNVVTHFGSDGNLGNGQGSWDLGRFYWMLAGLTVTSDGRTVYTAEVGNNRVQRWDAQLDGSYAPTRAVGASAATDPNRQGNCNVPGLFAAPYDVAVDRAGDLYVVNTSCAKSLHGNPPLVEVQEFSPSGAWMQTIHATDFPWNLTHGLGVDAVGNVYVPQADLIVQPDTAPVPAPDPGPAPVPVPTPQPPAANAAPVLHALTLPATTSTSTITLAIDATDDIAVTQMRLATENGNWGAWQAFSASPRFALTPGVGARGVFLQVRDGASLESTVLYRTTSVIAAPVVPDPQPNPNPNPAPNPQPPVVVPIDGAAAPVLRSVTLPATTTTNAITVAIAATDDAAVSEMRLASENGVWGAWSAFRASAPFTLTAGAGPRGVFVQVRDAGKRESGVLYRTTRVEAGAVGPNPQPVPVDPPALDAAPVLSSITLPKVTPTRQVAVKLTASDDHAITGVRLANEDGNWGAWRASGALTQQQTLTPRALTKGVFAQVRDAAGHTSAVLYTTTLCSPCTVAPAAKKSKSKSKSKSRRLPLAIRRAVKAARHTMHHGNRRTNHLHYGRGSQNVDLSQFDHHRDTVDCGAGFDTVLLQPEDRAKHCERVVRVHKPRTS